MAELKEKNECFWAQFSKLKDVAENLLKAPDEGKDATKAKKKAPESQKT